MKNDLQYANSLEILHKFDWGKKYLIEMTIVNWYTWHWWTSEDQSICCLQPWSNPKLSGQGNRSGFVHSDIWWFNFYLNVFYIIKNWTCTYMYVHLCGPFTTIGFINLASQHYSKRRTNAQSHRKIKNPRKGDILHCYGEIEPKM